MHLFSRSTITKLAVTLTLILSFDAQAAPSTGASPGPGKSIGKKTRSEPGLGGKLEVDPAFGVAMIGPADVNGLIHDNNDAIQKAGVKSFNADDIGTTTYWGLATTYRIAPSVGLGLGFAHLGATSEGSAKVGDNSLSGKYQIGASFLTVESRITVFGSRREKLEGLVSPFLGMGFYSASSTLSGSALAKGSIEVESSAQGIVFGTNATARYWFLPNLAGGLTTGYRFAKSGTLKVKSQKGSDQGVGSEVESNGKKISVDAGSFLIGLNLTWAL